MRLKRAVFDEQTLHQAGGIIHLLANFVNYRLEKTGRSIDRPAGFQAKTGISTCSMNERNWEAREATSSAKPGVRSAGRHESFPSPGSATGSDRAGQIFALAGSGFFLPGPLVVASATLFFHLWSFLASKPPRVEFCSD